MTADHRDTPAWDQIRRSWIPAVATGAVICRRCATPINPATPWDLGHPDDTPAAEVKALPITDELALLLAPEHRACNRSAGGRDGTAHRRTNARAIAPPDKLWPGI